MHPILSRFTELCRALPPWRRAPQLESSSLPHYYGHGRIEHMHLIGLGMGGPQQVYVPLPTVNPVGLLLCRIGAPLIKRVSVLPATPAGLVLLGSTCTSARLPSVSNINLATHLPP